MICPPHKRWAQINPIGRQAILLLVGCLVVVGLETPGLGLLTRDAGLAGCSLGRDFECSIFKSRNAGVVFWIFVTEVVVMKGHVACLVEVPLGESLSWQTS